MTEVVLVEAADTFTYVAVKGNLDAAGVGQADLRLTSQTVTRRKPSIIDLNEVGFIASLGIGMLAAIAKALRAHHVGLAVVSGPSPVRDVLELTNLSPLIHVVGSRAEALQALDLA
jgi:anti-anti-sigma factor